MENDMAQIIALILAVAIGIRIAGIPRWFSSVKRNWQDLREGFPEVTSRAVFAMIFVAVTVELAIYAIVLAFISSLIQ